MGEKHQCSARAYSISCRNCNEEIYFSDDYLSKNGKKIPLSVSDDEPHNCRPFVVKCKDCGVEIVFSDEEVTESGKHIPLTKKSGAHHRCSAKPFNKETRRRWWYEQEAKAERERERYRREYNEYQYRTSQVKELEYCKILEIPLTATNQMIKRIEYVRFNGSLCNCKRFVDYKTWRLGSFKLLDYSGNNAVLYVDIERRSEN